MNRTLSIYRNLQEEENKQQPQTKIIVNKFRDHGNEAEFLRSTKYNRANSVTKSIIDKKSAKLIKYK